MNSYPSYKDSGVEWIGGIPSDWVKTKFKWDIFYQEGPGLRTFQFTESGIRVICVSNITEKGIDFSTTHTRHISEDEYSEKYRHFTVDDRDILLSSSGSIGKVSRYYFDGQSVILNTSTIRLHSKNRNKVYDDFIPYYLSSEYVQLQLRFLMTGGVVNNFGPSHLDQLFMYLPTISEQTQIVSFLDTKTQKIDELIEKTEQKIKLLKEKRTSLINHCVTKGLNPNVEMKDSGVEWIGEIPRDWDIKKIKYLKSSKKYSLVDGPFGSNLKTIHYVDDGDVYIIESGFITSGKFQYVRDFKTITNEHFETIKRSECNEGDIIISKIGEYYGMCGILPKLDKRTVISGNSVTLTISKNHNTKFIHQVIIQHRINGTFKKEVQQTGQPFISLGVINNLIIPTPNLSEQTQIIEYLDEQTQKIDSTIEKETQRIELLKEYRQSLISEVVTGKVDVRDWKE